MNRQDTAKTFTDQTLAAEVGNAQGATANAVAAGARADAAADALEQQSGGVIAQIEALRDEVRDVLVPDAEQAAADAEAAAAVVGAPSLTPDPAHLRTVPSSPGNTAFTIPGVLQDSDLVNAVGGAVWTQAGGFAAVRAPRTVEADGEIMVARLRYRCQPGTVAYLRAFLRQGNGSTSDGLEQALLVDDGVVREVTVPFDPILSTSAFFDVGILVSSGPGVEWHGHSIGRAVAAPITPPGLDTRRLLDASAALERALYGQALLAATVYATVNPAAPTGPRNFHTVTEAVGAAKLYATLHRPWHVTISDGVYNEGRIGDAHARRVDYLTLEGATPRGAEIRYDATGVAGNAVDRDAIAMIGNVTLIGLVVTVKEAKYAWHLDSASKSPDGSQSYRARAVGCLFRHLGGTGVVGHPVGIGIRGGQHVELVDCEYEIGGTSLAQFGVFAHNVAPGNNPSTTPATLTMRGGAARGALGVVEVQEDNSGQSDRVTVEHVETDTVARGVRLARTGGAGVYDLTVSVHGPVARVEVVHADTRGRRVVLSDYDRGYTGLAEVGAAIAYTGSGDAAAASAAGGVVDGVVLASGRAARPGRTAPLLLGPGAFASGAWVRWDGAAWVAATAAEAQAQVLTAVTSGASRLALGRTLVR